MYVVIPEYFVLRDRSPLFQWCWPVNLCFFFADSLSFLAKETKLWLFHRFFVRDRAHSNRRSLFSGVQTFLAIMCIFGDFGFCLFLNSQPGVYTDTDPLHDYRNPFFFTSTRGWVGLEDPESGLLPTSTWTDRQEKVFTRSLMIGSLLHLCVVIPWLWLGSWLLMCLGALHDHANVAFSVVVVQNRRTTRRLRWWDHDMWLTLPFLEGLECTVQQLRSFLCSLWAFDGNGPCWTSWMRN